MDPQFNTIVRFQAMATLIVTLSILLLALSWWWICSKRKKNAAPGPLAIPLLGHLHLLGSHPHRSLSILSKKFGSVMSINLGFVSTLVISSPDAAKAILSTHDIVFASRPRIAAAKHIFFNAKDLVWREYGSYWRKMKKVAILELFTVKRLEESKKLRMEEISRLVSSIAREGDNGRVPIDMNAKLSMANMNLVSSMAFSQRFEESSLVELLQETIGLVTAFVPSDYFPFLAWMDDYLGTVQRMKAAQGKLGKIFQAIIDDHRRVSPEKQQRAPDLVDVLLLLDEMDDNDRKGLIMDMFSAGVDTASITTEWALSELIRNPAYLLKAQHEIDQAVGFDRPVNEDDLRNIGYIKAIAKETFRLHPAVPLLIPHESTQECLVNELRVPAKTRATVNVWSIGRDPQWWQRPEVFDPDRFAGSEIDVKGQHFELLPFGSGRRICPGMGLGLAMVELTLARLIQGFEWSLDGGLEELDMEEEFGVTLRRKVPLRALATPRMKAEF